jgi:hypothetical protein
LKWTVTYTLRFKMRPETKRALLSVKYLRSSNGVQFAKRFSVGRERDFPFHTSSDRKLKLIEAPIITVTGKAYWDVGHAPKDQSNRRSHLPGYAAWEIHPVMKLTVL